MMEAPRYTNYDFGIIAGAAIGMAFLLASGSIVYNLFLHPLRKYPGPILYRATKLAFALRLVRGNLPHHVLAWHTKYGPVVRIAPDQLAFSDPEAWKDIYGHRTDPLAGKEEMPKLDLFFRTPGIPVSIVAESRANHTKLRRLMSHGFSERAMREQESLIVSYVQLLIRRLHEKCWTSTKDVTLSENDISDSTQTLKLQVQDMNTWYNWTTFDIIGDLAFGESFGCLDNAVYHPWITAIMDSIKTAGMFDALAFSQERVKRRMELQIERSDFLDGLIQKKQGQPLALACLTTNASLLVLAGSGTTATLLSGVTYLLLNNPQSMAKLAAEVRSSFSSEEEITLLSVNKLTYMLACLNEALRCYPPVVFGLPRVVPKGGSNIAGHFVPQGTVVACWQWAMNHMPENWEDPWKYSPERFLEDNPNTRDRLEAMQPFSVGPRNCLGRNLAYAEMRLILARIIFNFDLQLADPDFDWLKKSTAFILWKKPKLNVFLNPVRAA
ncbi:cytochrome p450 monooxygenase [Grosmannia clavigera kw1407]|uniref:Cytochrome p450 monooxygenase n=1 Tax=Grosmannia clavigera (strain kw1407 / UAMH 11150) TaxID=655863 RepID=F0XKG0_GROCL|nr:cytochrome p450 monooxygenase [Grosmannia clavigera kw1407]EFX01803.1 cytochrome p450 monooxygenase [Grosmannia clavigera kw1407]